MVFVEYADGHTGNCHGMYNLVSSQVCGTRDIFWCVHMYFTSENCEKTKVLQVKNCFSDHDFGRFTQHSPR